MAVGDRRREGCRPLRSYEILDAVPEATFDRLVRIARTLFDVPVTKIMMIDRDRAWTKAVVGEERNDKPRCLTFCNATVAMDGPLVVEDAASDERFHDHPSVVGAPHYRFYAEFPFRGRDGHPIGTLCCFDYGPRTATDDQIAALQDLGQLVVDALEMRLIAKSDTLQVL